MLVDSVNLSILVGEATWVSKTFDLQKEAMSIGILFPYVSKFEDFRVWSWHNVILKVKLTSWCLTKAHEVREGVRSDHLGTENFVQIKIDDRFVPKFSGEWRLVERTGKTTLYFHFEIAILFSAWYQSQLQKLLRLNFFKKSTTLIFTKSHHLYYNLNKFWIFTRPEISIIVLVVTHFYGEMLNNDVKVEVSRNYSAKWTTIVNVPYFR